MHGAHGQHLNRAFAKQSDWAAGLQADQGARAMACHTLYSDVAVNQKLALNSSCTSPVARSIQPCVRQAAYSWAGC